MAAANDASVVTCTNNSDYAVICSFFEQFGDKSGLLFPSFHDLQQMLENVEEVPYPLIELHVKLMRKLKKSVNFDRWEKAAAKYAHTYSDQDGWEIERFGYKKINLAVKLRLLKNLLEAQFDGNIKFKNEINKVTSDELRLQPLGKDIQGRRYWHLLDDDCNLRVYREDLDEESWDLVSSDKESMLKLIEHLNSCKDLQEDGGTSPATSEENSANGQEEYPKIDTEDQVQQPVECPTGAKRLKSESVEVPATSDSHMECIVGETIESPVLVIKGEGNGADCDTGNPGEGKNEESCESHCSNSEQGKLGNTSVVACESDELNPCTEPGDPLAILQPKAESFSSVSSSVCNSNTSTSGSDNVTKAHHSQLENETSVEAKSVTKLTVPENSSENPSALNSHDKEISGSSCKQTGSAIVHPPSSSADSCKEMIHVESSLTTVLHEDEPVSIEKPSVEANVFPNQEGYLKPSEDNGIAKESNDDENRPLIVDTTDRCAVPEQTSTFENSTQLPFSQNQELPKFGCSSPIVGLNPIQLKFATAEESAPISDGPISSDHCSPSTSEIVTPNLMPSTECIPSAIEEEKQIAEPLSVPACSTLVQKDSSEIEESHSEQIVELKNEPLENSNSNVIINANTTEAESQLPIQTTHESPAQSGINHEIVIPVVDCSTPCDENSIWKVDETSKSSDVPNVLKESNIEESGPLDFGVASAIQSAKSFLPGAVPVSERAANVAVVDCTKDSDPPSAPCSLQETPQCSESDPISGSTIPLTLKEENNYSSPGNESEGTNEVHSSRSDVPLTQTNDLTSVLPAVGTTSAPVPDVEKSSETRTCPDTVNQSDSDECVVNVVRTSPEPTSNEVDTVSVSKLSEFRCVSPEDLQDAEKLNSSTVQELTNEKEIQCTMEDKLHPVDNEPSTNRIENIADKEEPAETECLSSSEEQGGTDTTILKDEQSLRDLQKGNEITNTMDILDKKVSADESEAIEKIPNTSTEKSLFSTEKGDEFFVSQKNVLNEVRLEKALEKEEIESVRLTSRKDEITPVQHHCESDATSQEIILNQDDALKAEENNQATTLAEVPTGPDIAIVPDSSREMESSTISEDIKPEQVDESKAEENPMATTLAVIPSGSEVAEEPESNLKLESNEISQDLVSKQPDKPKAAEDSVATPPAKIPSEQEVADETDADPEHESNAISQNIEYKQADKPKAEEDSVATAPAEIPSAQEVADETNPDPEHESNAISQNIEPKQGDESKAEENSVVPALAEVPSEPEVAENPEPNPEQESDTISQDIQPKQADESKAEEDSIETAQAKIPSGSEVAEKSDPNQELESNAISQNREPTQADECKAEEDSTATALAVLPSRLEVAEEPDPNLELESNAISQDIEPKLTISQNSEPQQNYESKTEDDSAATALATVPTVPEVAEEPDTNQESNGISKDIETKRANKPKAEEEQVATALAKLPPKPNVRLDDPPKIESIIVETAKVLKEETEKDADISTPPEKQEAILLKFPKEVPHLMVSEIKEKSELMQGFDGNCKVSIDPVQKELKEEILVAVIKQESPSVHEEPESNSIPMIPPKSEQWQTESGKVLTYKVPENEEVSVPTVKDVQSDVRNEVLSGATSEAATEKEPSGEDTKICVSESEQSEEKVKISSFKQELVIPKGQLNTELQSDGDTMMSSQLEIPVLLVKEESPPMVPDKSISDDIRDGCGSKIPIAVPEKNQGEERSVADELETIPRSASSDGKEPVQKTPALSIPEKEEKEAVAISEVVKSEESDTLPKVPNSSETPQNVEEKTTDQPSTEKSSNLNQLTFDFDSSAPVAIILPPSKKPDTSTKRRGRKRGRCGLDGNTDSGKENDAQPMVLRQSSRIAKLREKEDEDRRKEEAARLQRLKEEHERREKRRSARDEKMKKMEEKQQRRQLKTTTREDVTYRQSEEESSSSDEEKNSEEEGRKKKSKKDKRKHKKKKIDRPWDSTDSSEKSSESDVDGLDDLQVEEENEELVFKSDHEFSPESDLDDEEETVQPTKHARTARAGIVPKKRGRSKKVKVEEEIEEEEAVATEEEEEEEEAKCHKCGQSDHPEWILLCDRCDGGWHANCVKPPLLVIPEGHWFCPPCDHATLLERLQERLEAYEFLLQEKEAELERKKEQELEAKLAKEEADKQALLEAEEEAQEDDEEDEKISEAGDLGADGEDEETSEDSGEDEDEEDEDDAENDESDENLNGRRQRKAAKQANYSFKDFDDMIKSALRDEGDEEEEESGGKGKGKGPRSGVEGNSEDDEDKPRSPPGSRPSGIGNKRISTSDDDSDVMPQVLRKKKARKLNDLSATSNEDDSDEDFQGSSAEGSDSDDDDEEASDSGDSFVVDDDSDDDDVIHVRAKKKARVASPTIRRSARSSRKRNLRMDSSDTSEEESEYEEKPTKRKKGNESWDSSGASSSDASWGRSKKRSATKSRAKPVAAPKPKPKPPPRKAPANRGRGRGGRTNKVESDDEPFRSNVSVKKLKEAQPVKAQEEEDSDHAQKRTTRGRQISYKELISSGDSQDEDGNTAKKMGTLFAADRIRNMPGAAIRGGASRRGGRGGVITQAPSRVNVSGDDSTPVPVSVISSRIGAALNQDDESRFSGSTDTIEFSSAVASATAAASAYTTGDESHTSTDIVTPSIDPDLSTLPLVLPQEDEASPLIKEELPAIVPVPVLSQDLQISRLIQQRPVDVPPTLPPDLQINRLINSHTISSSNSSPARQSPGILPQQRLLRDVLDSQTPPPAVQLSPILPTQPPIIAPSVEPPLYSHGGVIKQTRHSLPPTPPLYSSPHVVKTSDLIASSTPPSVIRPYPTTATASPLSPSISGSSTPGNPLSIQGLLGTGHGSPGSNPSAPPSSHPSGHLRPYGNTSHMIGHGPFLNHTPYGSPYSAVPPSRTSYMGTPVTPTPRPAYSPMYPTSHMPPHGLPLHSPYQHHGPPLRPTSSYQHAGFPQAFAAAAAAAASAEEERRIYRVAAQTSRESGADNYEPAASAGLLLKGGAEDPAPATAVPPESEFGGLVSYFSSQQEDFEES
ncbi:uncharacterized protein LOC130695810 [Daphnia carinata]|uniref:uncharacterized protein LOC130695810 n=1 Tax=Daphnia carinata TaxID=120202 RepID=UPI00286963F5|nr:uncharacterized protein LOC130695810 [Daphnia carinata]